MKVDSYSFGKIVIEGTSYNNDVIIFEDRVFSPWWRMEGHNLHMEDLSEVMKKAPETLIIGTGYSGIMKVPMYLVEKLSDHGIEVLIEKSKRAVDIYNKKAGQGVVAAIHLTC